MKKREFKSESKRLLDLMINYLVIKLLIAFPASSAEIPKLPQEVATVFISLLNSSSLNEVFIGYCCILLSNIIWLW